MSDSLKTLKIKYEGKSKELGHGMQHIPSHKGMMENFKKGDKLIELIPENKWFLFSGNSRNFEVIKVNKVSLIVQSVEPNPRKFYVYESPNDEFVLYLEDKHYGVVRLYRDNEHNRGILENLKSLRVSHKEECKALAFKLREERDKAYNERFAKFLAANPNALSPVKIEGLSEFENTEVYHLVLKNNDGAACFVIVRVKKERDWMEDGECLQLYPTGCDDKSNSFSSCLSKKKEKGETLEEAIAKVGMEYIHFH